MRPVTRAFGKGESVSRAFSHIVLYLSFFSIIYPVIGAPPSLTGSFQTRSTWFAVQSAGSGAPGADGTAVNEIV